MLKTLWEWAFLREAKPGPERNPRKELRELREGVSDGGSAGMEVADAFLSPNGRPSQPVTEPVLSKEDEGLIVREFHKEQFRGIPELKSNSPGVTVIRNKKNCSSNKKNFF